MKQNKLRKTIDNWALVLALVLATVFILTIFAKTGSMAQYFFHLDFRKFSNQKGMV